MSDYYNSQRTKNCMILYPADNGKVHGKADHSGYLRYAVRNCLLALEELKKANAELLEKMSQHEPMNINRTGSLNRIVQDYLIVRVAGLFDKDSRTVSFFDEFHNNKNYIRIRRSEIVQYLIKMRNKSVAHKDKDHLFEFPTTSKILQSNLCNLLNDLLELLK